MSRCLSSENPIAEVFVIQSVARLVGPPQLNPVKCQLPVWAHDCIYGTPACVATATSPPAQNSECQAILKSHPTVLPFSSVPTSSSSFTLSCPALFSSVSMSVSSSPADTPSLSSSSSILPYFFLSSWANSRSSFSYLTATLETMPHHESLFSICISFRIECYLSKLRPNWRADACSVSLPRKARGDCRPFRIKGQQAYEIPNRTASHYL